MNIKNKMKNGDKQEKGNTQCEIQMDRQQVEQVIKFVNLGKIYRTITNVKRKKGEKSSLQGHLSPKCDLY